MYQIQEKTLKTLYQLAAEYADTIQENLSWEEKIALDETRIILGVSIDGDRG